MQKSNQDSIKVGRTALDYLVKGEEIIIVAVGTFISVAMFIQILLRYVFHAPLFGLEEISILVVSWFYFIGSAYSVHTESFIKADILPLVVKNPRIIRVFNIISLVLTIIATSLLFFYGLKYAIWSGGSHVVTPTFLISVNYGFSALVVGSILMSLHFFLLLLREIKRKI